MRKTACAAAVVVALLPACGGDDVARDVDLLLVGGAVYTLEWPPPDGADGRPSPASSWTEAHGWRPSANAVAIEDGRIVWVGSDADAAPWRGRAARVVDVEGAAVLPGVVDPADALRAAIRAGSADTVTVEEAIRAATGAGIVVGSIADLTVVTPDPFRTPPAAWLEAGRITHTIVAGRVVQEGVAR